MKADLAVNGTLEEAVAFAYKHNQNNEAGSSYCAKCRESIAKEYRESVKNGRLKTAAFSGEKELRGGKDVSIFLSQKNTVCRNFPERAGAERGVNEYLLILRKGTQRLNGGSRMGCPKPLGKESHGQLEKLHDEIFPGIYISGAELVSDRNGNHAGYGIIEKGRLIAYGVLRIDSSTGGTAEIVGVEAGYRHKGYGRTVLSYLVERAFEDYGMDKIRLVVDGENENAIRLYRDLGFTEEGENCFYSLKL